MLIHGEHKKIVSNRVEQPRPLKLCKTLGVKEFYHKRNKVLIIRAVGGLGDILMHRMLFEDIKKAIGDGEVHFACPIQYHEALIDHPYLGKVLNSATIDRSNYIISYNTTTACGRYEMKKAPFSDKHRSDIWAEHCGLSLSNHEMHIRLTDKEKQEGLDIIEYYRDRPGKKVVICPVSAMVNKNLLEHQLMALVKNLHERGCYVVGLHNHPIISLINKNIPSIHNLSIRQWMGVLNAADYVVSVDTSSFHCAGGLKKPLMGIFTFADGEIYGKYFDFVLVQKHRNLDPCWNCGPCYNWGDCPKSKTNPKPCLTEITSEMLINGLNKMFEKWQ